ncbi:hypothetical protein L6452_14743, partial [Arctium lappa]
WQSFEHLGLLQIQATFMCQQTELCGWKIWQWLTPLWVSITIVGTSSMDTSMEHTTLPISYLRGMVTPMATKYAYYFLHPTGGITHIILIND